METNDHEWVSPPLSTTSSAAVVLYRRGITELVAGLDHAAESLADAIAIDTEFYVARVGLAAARAAAGQAYVAPHPSRSTRRGERQHGEIVAAALTGDGRHGADLRREHLLEYPGDLLIVWLPALVRLEH